jgi:hypothetical protein
MRSSSFISCPQEGEGSEDDNRSHYHAAEFPWSETKQQGDNHSERNGPEDETRCRRHTNQTHHQKADSNEHSSKLRVITRQSPGCRLAS